MDKGIVYKSLLYDFYGELLTDKQKDIVDMYYNSDLTLSEISEQIGISRQGVYDTLKRADNTLKDYESKLGLVEKFLNQKTFLSKISIMLDEVLFSKNESIEDLKSKIKDIKDIVRKLI